MELAVTQRTADEILKRVKEILLEGWDPEFGFLDDPAEPDDFAAYELAPQEKVKGRTVGDDEFAAFVARKGTEHDSNIHRIAGYWHSGQFSGLYAVANNRLEDLGVGDLIQAELEAERLLKEVSQWPDRDEDVKELQALLHALQAELATRPEAD